MNGNAPMTPQQLARYNFWRGCGWSLMMFLFLACCGVCGVLEGVLMFGSR